MLQGSVLSCTLFAMAINDVITAIPQSVNSLLYVDDWVIYTSGSYIPAIERRLQQTIRNVNDWTIRSDFTISTEKTVTVKFHSKRGLPTEPRLKLEDKNISFETPKKFLGFIYDQRLQWKIHIEELRRKCTKAINILKTPSHSN